MAGQRRPKHWCLPEGLAQPEDDPVRDEPGTEDAAAATDAADASATEPDGPAMPEGSDAPAAIEKPVEPAETTEPAEPAKPVKPRRPRRKRKRRARGGVRCPVCGNAGGKPDATERATCGTCGVVFMHKRPTLGEMAKARDARFARAFALPYHEERREAKALANEVMRGYFRILRGKPVALNGFGRSMLEVSCGLGMRLRAFQGYGWTVAGTESSVTAYEYARRQSLDVQHGWLADGRFGKTKFNLALFCANFGEMADPHGTAERLREILIRDGLVCVLLEPLVRDDAATLDEARLFVHTPDSIKRAFTRNKCALVSQDRGDGVGTFWFKTKTWRGR